MAEKLSGKSNSSGVTTIPILIFHIHSERRGEEFECSSCTGGDIPTSTPVCEARLSSPRLPRRARAQICHRISLSFMAIFVLRENKHKGGTREGERMVIRAALPPRRLISLLVRVVLSLCWRLRVLSMEMKFLLCHLCPLKKD